MVGLGRRALGARCVLFALGVAFSSAVGGGAPSSQGAERTNRLAQETSPYLLLHAHNPVDWYPWGEAALQRAKQENKLIFLSIGYSSCHWCHVMERESFVDPEIAAFLNEHFICIKVDREERPDVDDIYMMAVQAITGRGGWPLSVFLTPDAKPFFGGTYFPARDGDREGAIGFLTILQRIHALWPARAELLQQDAERLTDLVKSQLATVPAPDPIVLSPDTMALIQQKLHDDFDPEFGGFGYDPRQPQRPKFPEPANLAFLVYRARTHQDAEALAMLELTLQKMGDGGIYDHVGGGFHRYATDRKWQIPHFEKMLYDNAQLLNIYAQAFALRPNAMYRQIVVETAECLRRDFLAPSGAYFAALDAESEGAEGRYYAWDRQEVERVVGGDLYPLYAQRMGLDQPPNFETWHVLQGAIPVLDLAQQRNMPIEQLQAQLDGARQKLLLQRQQRVAPRLDNKILTAWNGLAIQGLANAGRLLDDPRYVGAARDAANFVWQHLRRDDGQLWHTHTSGKASLNAYLDDYAFYAQGLLALHAATHEPQWLDRAEQIMAVQQELFADREQGGFFFTSAGHEQLIARGKQFLDGAVPAGNAIAAQNLAYLARLPDHEEQRQQAARLMQAASSLWRNQPHGLPHLAIAWEMLAEKP